MENLRIKSFKSEVTVRCGDYEYTAPNYKVYTFKDALAQMVLTSDRVGYIKVGSDATPAAGLVKYDLEAPYDPNVYTAGVTYGLGSVWTKDINEDGEFPILVADQSIDSAGYYCIVLRYTDHTEQWLRGVYRSLFSPGKTIKVNPSPDPSTWDYFIIREVDDISTPGEYVIKAFGDGLSGTFYNGVISPAKPQYGRGDYYSIVGGKNGDVVSNVIYDIPTRKIQVNTTVAHEVNPGDSVYIYSTTNSSWEFTGTYTIDSIAVDRKSFVVVVSAPVFGVLLANPSLLVVSNMKYTVGSSLDTTAVMSFTWFDSELSVLENGNDNTGTGSNYGEFGLFSESGLMLARFVLTGGAQTKNAGHHLSVLWKYTIEW